MSIRFSCTACGKRLKAAPEHVGLRVKCSGCGERIVVPAAESAIEPSPGDRNLPASRPPAHVPATHAPAAHVPAVAQVVPAAAALDDDYIPSALPTSKPMSDEDLVDMTAMVDIVFFLLIFFMVTSMAKLQESLEIPPPDVSESEDPGKQVFESDPDYVEVRIENDDTVWVNDAEAPTPQEVIAKLRTAKEEDGVTRMRLEANGDARHETVVMVLDAGSEAEMDGIMLVSIEEE